MKIVNVLFSKSYTGFYFDDQAAIKFGAGMDGFIYEGETLTNGFSSIRQAGEAISLMFMLEDGQIAYGDCAAVQYSGTGGRDPLFLADEYMEFFDKKIKSLLIGEDISKFRELAEKYDNLKIDGKRLHTALRYGITQALLDATSKANKMTMAEVVRKEYGIESDVYNHIPIFTQSGDQRYSNVDKMVIKNADVLPHALINNVKDKLGTDGEKLEVYVKWLRDRIIHLRDSSSYNPVLHIDVYGNIGLIFDHDISKIFKYLKRLANIAEPFKLRIEGPIDMDERTLQMEFLRDITKLIDDNNVNLEIVADEWCNTFDDIRYFADNKAGHMLQVKTPDLGGVNNTIEALLYCKEKNIGAYSGGTCNETGISAKISTNIAIACNADQCLAKPGMGTDEGFMIVKNEMNRVITLIDNGKKRV